MPKSKGIVEDLQEFADDYRKTYKAGLGLDPDKDYVAAAKEKAAELVENLGKGARNYGRSYKEGLGMKPETDYEKKRGGSVKKARKTIRGYD
jgi:hypothetical protein